MNFRIPQPRRVAAFLFRDVTGFRADEYGVSPNRGTLHRVCDYCALSVRTEESFDARATLEAIDSFGYLQRSVLPSLLALLVDAMIEGPKRVYARYRGLGEQLSRDEKRVAGVRANACLSRQAFGELAERGKAIPLQAYELTLLPPINCEIKHAI